MGDVHNAIKYAGGIAQAIAVYGGLDRATSALERVSETLQGSFDPTTLDELAIQRGEHLWSRMATAGPTAAQTSQVAVTLRPDSKAIVVVKGCSVSSGAGAAVLARLSLNSRANVVLNALTGVPVANRDSRLPRDPNATFTQAPPEVEVSAGTSAVSLIQNFLDEIRLLAGVQQDFPTFRDGGVILKPGAALACENTLVNQAFDVTFWGRVRMALPGELVVA